MTRIEKKKLYEEVADIIGDEIRTGKLQEGDKLPSIQKLAETYGVGQASIREALNALRVMGLVTIKHGEGTFVESSSPKAFMADMKEVTYQDIVELLEVRKIIEVAAVRIAALKVTEESKTALKAALDSMKQAIDDNELGEKSDFDFHMAIAEATNNSLLKKLLADISDVMRATMKETRKIWIYNRSKSIEKLYNEHLAIYEAIMNHDAELAAASMAKHLEEVEEVLIQHFEI